MKEQHDYQSTAVVIALLLILTVPLTIAALFLSRPTQVLLDTDRDGRSNFTLTVESAGRPVPVAMDRIVRNDLRQRERIITFQIREGWRKVGSLWLTLRQIDNNDFVYFLNYKPYQSGIDLKLAVTAKAADPVMTASQIEYPAKINNTSSRWRKFIVTAQNTSSLLPTNPLILESQTHSLRLGPAEVFRPLANGVRQWVPDQSGAVIVSQITEDLRFTCDIPGLLGTFTETWGILSSEPLINWQAPKAVQAALTADLASYRKLAKEGFYYLTPANYTPSAETAFWLNPAYHVGELFRRQDGGRYFADLSIVSMYSALNTQTKDGFWLSSPSSDWLAKDYQLTEGFFDTRFSTDAAIFLLHMYQQTGEKKALQGAARFAAALRAYTLDHGIPTSGGGVLVPDYFKPGTKHRQTHVSLNHLVTEMNFLYEMFLENSEPANLKTANQIRQAVRDTGAKWIKANGDLHYSYLPDGSFGGQDYPLLTLKDLRLSQKLIHRLTGSEDEVFALLIKAKEAYLKKNNLPLN